MYANTEIKNIYPYMGEDGIVSIQGHDIHRIDVIETGYRIISENDIPCVSAGYILIEDGEYSEDNYALYWCADLYPAGMPHLEYLGEMAYQTVNQMINDDMTLFNGV